MAVKSVKQRARLVGKGVESGFNSGTLAVNVLHVAANVADGETVTIGSEVYEFDVSGNGVSTGNIAVTPADATPANATDALIVAITSNTSYPIKALDVDDNTVAIVSKTAIPLQLACAETLAGAGNAWERTQLAPGGYSSVKFAYAERVPTSEEVSAGKITFAFDFKPVKVDVAVRSTANGSAVAWDGATSIDWTNGLVVLDNSGVVDWDGTHTVAVKVFGV